MRVTVLSFAMKDLSNVTVNSAITQVLIFAGLFRSSFALPAPRVVVSKSNGTFANYFTCVLVQGLRLFRLLPNLVVRPNSSQALGL